MTTKVGPAIGLWLRAILKDCLWRHGMIKSPECRRPLTSMSPALADELDRLGPGRVTSAA